jgi:RHS repeat-associated protein
MTRFTYTGEQTDASIGLEYLRARYYDAETGRFLSLDPLGDGYDYAYDNPVMFTDPSGLSPVTGEACADIKDRISNLNGGAPKIEERIRRIWQSVYDQWCGGGGGGDNYCGWTTDCSNGRGCDSTVVSRASAPVEGACWFDDEQPHRLRWSDILPQRDCGGILGKLGCFLTSDCGSAVVSGGELVLSFHPVGNAVALGITSGYAIYDKVNQNNANFAVDFQGTAGNELGIIGATTGDRLLGGVSVATSAISTVYYGSKCLF